MGVDARSSFVCIRLLHEFFFIWPLKFVLGLDNNSLSGFNAGARGWPTEISQSVDQEIKSLRLNIFHSLPGLEARAKSPSFQ